MFTSLRSRLWLSYAGLIFIALGIVAIVLLIYLYRNPLSYRRAFERLQAVETVMLEREENQLGRLKAPVLERAARNFNVRLVQYALDQTVIFDTGSNTSPALPFPNQNMLTRGVPFTTDAKGKDWLYSISELSNETWLVVATPRPRPTLLNLFTDDLLPLFIRGGLIALLLSLLAAFVFARWIADPLQKVIAAARGVPDQPAMVGEVTGPREVQDLAVAFDSMIMRLQSSQKSQRDFVADVSHELKTPLTSIQGFAQAILDGTAQTDEARKQAAVIIHSEAGRMNRIVLDLLDLARLEAGTADITMAPVDIGLLLNQVCDKFLPQARNGGVVLTVESARVLPMVMGDGDRLAQVITNLVDNAVKFTPSGGRVRLMVEVEPQTLMISVVDDGPGITPDDQRHVFDRFYQADRSRSGGAGHGSGLGLAIAKEIVLAHGGTISVRSQPGQGTTFMVQLPLGTSGTTTDRHIPSRHGQLSS
jgi:signal transduction histidine kinase